ncbi:hypothetical protein C3F09_12645 [candidate division GN15 bacterium]|uniref:Uncharacterized protein n=1 Tax=candidate division GN15 bacterium TaxID=2072418 RepID=A0A855X2W2_9BACT|nr:MAG: hypothetical protein C3F09_12645 [candidate division GN15 bacterium]
MRAAGPVEFIIDPDVREPRTISCRDLPLFRWPATAAAGFAWFFRTAEDRLTLLMLFPAFPALTRRIFINDEV